MILLIKLLKLCSALTLSALLVACGTDSSSSGGDSSDDGSGSGPSFSLRLTDAAFDDAARVDITFVGVRLRKSSGGWITVPVESGKKKIELASLQGSKSAGLILDVDVDPGDYDEIRLIVDTSNLANSIELTSGGVFNLRIPSGGSSGLKIKGDFTVSDTRPTSVVVDVDLRQSIIRTGANNFMMRPVLRLINGNNFGHARGMVDPSSLIAASCSDAQADSFNSVYVYNGHNVSPDDINQQSSSNIDPITTSKITYDPAVSKYVYEAAFLPAGDYTIAFTCNSNLDFLDSDDNLQFFGTQNITIQVNNTTFL